MKPAAASAITSSIKMGQIHSMKAIAKTRALFLAMSTLLFAGHVPDVKAEETYIASNFAIVTNSTPNTSGHLVEYSGLSGMPGPGFGIEGAFRMGCNLSHLSYDDPIVFPGQSGASHLHHFFGNTLVDYNSTYSSLRQTGSGTCDGKELNRTGYWFPAMIDPVRNKVIGPKNILIYYKALDGASNELSQTRNLVRGLKIVAGPRPGFESDTEGFVGWACEAGNGAPDTAEHTTIAAISSCPSTNRFRVWLDFPTCWDGVNLWLSDRSHMAYANSGTNACPPGYSVRIPHITVILFWSHSGQSDYQNWYLSSDRHNGANYDGGETFHSDWFGAWDQDVSNHWARECDGITVGGGSGTRRECDVGVLGQFAGNGNVQQLANITAPSASQEFTIPDLPSVTRRGKRWRFRR